MHPALAPADFTDKLHPNDGAFGVAVGSRALPNPGTKLYFIRLTLPKLEREASIDRLLRPILRS